MSRRTLISLAASVIVGIACVATISTDAFAYRRAVGVGRVGVGATLRILSQPTVLLEL
jgi:hypothetical protein